MSNELLEDIYLRIALGEYYNIESDFKFGRNPSIGASEEVVWDGGGDYTFLSSAEKINVVSDNVADVNAGAGAWNLLMFGLDENFNEITETIVLNGTTPVQSANQYLRLFRAFIIEGGTTTAIGGANQGTISFTSDSTTTLQAQILPNNGQTLMAIYTVPAGKTMLVTGGTFNVGEGKDCVFKAKFRNCTSDNCVFTDKYSVELFESPFFAPFKTPLTVPEKTDVVITGVNGATTVPASASFGFLLKDNEVN